LPTGLSGTPKDWSHTRIEAEFGEAREIDWSQLHVIQPRYNRVVVFPAHLFHRIDLPGATASDWTRLTQNIYLDLTTTTQR
jgi:hypothetical protein